MLTKEEDGFGEEDEALRIVEVIAFGRTVEVGPVKELLPADEIDRDVLVQAALINFRLELLISDGDLDLVAQILNGKAGVFHHPVIGHDQLDLASQVPQGFREGSSHIRQPSCLGKRDGLRSHEENL